MAKTKIDKFNIFCNYYNYDIKRYYSYTIKFFNVKTLFFMLWNIKDEANYSDDYLQTCALTEFDKFLHPYEIEYNSLTFCVMGVSTCPLCSGGI